MIGDVAVGGVTVGQETVGALRFSIDNYSSLGLVKK